MSNLKQQIKSNVLWFTLARPDVRNAFNDEMIAEMTEAFQEINKNSQVRAVVIQGAGESFCAGGDLNWMKSMVDYDHSENIKDSEKLYEMYEALQQVQVPVLCKVHGHAMGGALGLIAASDIVFAEEDTQFCFSEVRLGLAPAVISAFVKTKILPRDMYRYFLTAEVFDSADAFDMGLIHGYGSIDEVDAYIARTAKKITDNGPIAVRATKRLISELSRTDDLKKTTTEVIANLRVGDEGQEGLKAFFEKRKPSWME